MYINCLFCLCAATAHLRSICDCPLQAHTLDRMQACCMFFCLQAPCTAALLSHRMQACCVGFSMRRTAVHCSSIQQPTTRRAEIYFGCTWLSGIERPSLQPHRCCIKSLKAAFDTVQRHTHRQSALLCAATLHAVFSVWLCPADDTRGAGHTHSHPARHQAQAVLRPQHLCA